MSDELVLYTNPMSRGRTARWMLEEIGRPYWVEVMAYGPSMRTPDYLALNPMGKVPTLRHGEVVVTECAAICTYLADAFPEAGLAPAPGDPRRGPYLRWLFFAAGPVEAAVTNRALEVQPSEQQSGFVGYGSYERVLDALEGLLRDRQYVLGDSFSAADVYLGSQIGWGVQFGTMQERPGFRAYWNRLAARPAAQRAKAADDALMPARER